MISYRMFIYLFHFLLIGPILFYIGHLYQNNIEIPHYWYKLLLFFGISTTFYHIYMAYNLYKLENSI